MLKEDYFYLDVKLLHDYYYFKFEIHYLNKLRYVGMEENYKILLKSFPKEIIGKIIKYVKKDDEFIRYTK